MTAAAVRRLGTRLAPGGSAIALRTILHALRSGDAQTALPRALLARFPGRCLSFHASGREAMRVAVARLAAVRGRNEIAIPAYGCFSIPASVVAAGLRVRLVDVDAQGQLAPEAVEKLPLDRIAAIVVGNLFGLPEPIEALARVAREAGVALIDDAAQALGAIAPEGAVGARGEVGILSFGRGKPLSALGGGAVIWDGADRDDDALLDARPGQARASESHPQAQEERPSDTRPGKPRRSGEMRGAGGLGSPQRSAAALRALAYDVSRQPAVLGLLASIPALGIGKTVYDPGFERGAMGGAAVALAAALAPELDGLNAARRATAHALAERIRNETAFAPLLERPGATGVYPRLGLVAPSASRRDRALEALARYGATAMYPSPMDAIRALEPHRAGTETCPGARVFCERLLTLPTHPGLRGRRVDAVVAILAAN